MEMVVVQARHRFKDGRRIVFGAIGVDHVQKDLRVRYLEFNPDSAEEISPTPFEGTLNYAIAKRWTEQIARRFAAKGVTPPFISGFTSCCIAILEDSDCPRADSS